MLFGLLLALGVGGVTVAAVDDADDDEPRPEIEWVTQFGTIGDDNALSVFRHATGIYMFGRVRAALPGQTHVGGDDAYLAKFDFDGTVVWTRQFGTTEREGNVHGLFVHDTGVYTSGFTRGAFPDQTFAGGFSDAFVRKYDLDGNVAWTRQFGASGFDSANSIFVWDQASDDIDDVRVYVAGWVAAPGLPGHTYAGGGTDAFLRLYDEDGNEVWTRQFGSVGTEDPWDVTGDRSGVYLTGGARAAFPGQSYAGGFSDVFVRKYDFDGNEAWTRQFGSTGDDTTFTGEIATDETGVYVSGMTDGALPGQTNAGDYDAFVRKYNLRGKEMWTRQFGTPGYDEGHGISIHGGGVYVSGDTFGALPGQTYAGEGDAYVRRYSRGGAEVWTFQFGTAQYDEAFDVFADETGVYIAGLSAGDMPGPNAGGDDPFLAKLRQDKESGDD